MSRRSKRMRFAVRARWLRRLRRPFVMPLTYPGKNHVETVWFKEPVEVLAHDSIYFDGERWMHASGDGSVEEIFTSERIAPQADPPA